MKKWKKMIAVALTGVTLGVPLTQTVQAESMTYSQWSEQVKDVTPKIDSVHISAQGEFNTTGGETKPVSVTATLDALLDIAHLNTSGKASANVEGQAFGAEWALKDNDLVYSILGAPFEKVDISQQKDEIKKMIPQILSQMMMEQMKVEELNAKYAPLFDDLFDIEATDTEYVFNLKQNIDGKAYFEKHEVLLKEFKQYVIDEMKKQQEFTSQDEQRLAELDQHFNANAFAKLFSINPTYIVHYAKDTLNPLSIELNAVVKLKELIKSAGENAPEQISVKYKVTFDKYNEPVEVKLPATN